MKVKFANADVEVWKLRKGVVVYYEEYDVYLHIEDILKLFADFALVWPQGEGKKRTGISTQKFTWLEPH